MTSPQQPEIDNLLHQLAQSNLTPFAIIDLTARLQKLLMARYDTEHPLCDQPSFPHDSTDPDFEMVRYNYRTNPYTGFIERYGTAYSHDYNVSQELGEAAIRYILFEEAQS